VDERPTLEQIARLPARDRLTVLAALIADAEAALPLRDDAMRQLRRETRLTLAEIAELAGVSLATTKTVLRGVRKGSATAPNRPEQP